MPVSAVGLPAGPLIESQTFLSRSSGEGGVAQTDAVQLKNVARVTGNKTSTLTRGRSHEGSVTGYKILGIICTIHFY